MSRGHFEEGSLMRGLVVAAAAVLAAASLSASGSAGTPRPSSRQQARPVPSLTPAQTLREWRTLTHRGRVRAIPREGCAPLRAVFYAGTDWLRLATKLAATVSPCAQYYISVPPLVADKTQPRGDQAWRIRALGSNFHALSEVNFQSWSNWVASTGSTWFAAGVEARRRMGLMGYDVALGDSWALNEASSAVRQNVGSARANVREVIRGLYTGDGSQSRGAVFISGMSQATGELSVYQARLQDWLEDGPFWNDMSAWVADWSQELYGDVRNYAVPGTTLDERRVALNDYLQHELTLARAGSTVEALSYLEQAYNPLGNAAWAYDAAFGWTAVDSTLMQQYVSAQIEALRSYRPEADLDRFGFAWSPKNLSAMPAADFTAETDALLVRLATAVRDSGSSAPAACAGSCGGELAGAVFNNGWKTFAAWKPSVLAFATTEQTIPAGVASAPINVELRTHSGIPYTTGPALPVTLTSNATSGEFSSTASGPWSPTLTTTIAAGASRMTFYYRDTTLGTPTIRATAPGRTMATQTESVGVNARALSVSWSRAQHYLYATVAIADATGAPIPSALVSATILRNDLAYIGRSATTDGSGRVTYGLYRPPSGCYVLQLTGINAPGWDGATPNNRTCV
jgi:hypothetical protein